MRDLWYLVRFFHVVPPVPSKFPVERFTKRFGAQTAQGRKTATKALRETKAAKAKGTRSKKAGATA